MVREKEEEIVEFNIGDYFLIFKRRWLPAGFTLLLCTALSCLFAVYKHRPLYEARGQLLLQPSDPKSELTGVEEPSRKNTVFARQGDPLKTQAKLLTSGLLLESVIKELDLRTNEGAYISFDQARSGLIIKQVPNTDILEVKFSANDPQLSSKFVNSLMRAYLRFNANVQKSDVTAAREFIEKQLPKLKYEFEAASNSLRDFKSSNRIISLSSQAKEYAGLNSSLLAQERDLDLKLEAVTNRIFSLRNQLNIDPSLAIEISKLNDSESIQANLLEIQVATSDLETKINQYGPEHPNLIASELKLNALKNRLQQQVNSVLDQPASIPEKYLQLSDLQKSLISELVKADSERESLQGQVDTLKLQKLSLNKNISDFAQLEKIQLGMEQDVNDAKTRYMQLLENLKNLELTQVQVNENNKAQIIEKAIIPGAPVSGLNLKIAASGLFLGVFLATGVAFVLDITDRKIRTIKQLQSLLNYPLIGNIPSPGLFESGLLKLASDNIFRADSSRSNGLRCNSSAYRSYQEAYLKLTDFEDDSGIPKVLSIISSAANEGRSEVAANLAATIAQSGHQVLLVDANMKNPSQHELLDLENKLGFSNMLTGNRPQHVDLTQTVDIQNLDVMTAGSSEDILYASFTEQISNFINKRLSDYDTIIFDAGELLSGPNALLLSKCCDGILVISQLNQTEVIDAIEARKFLERLDVPVLGLIVNQG